MRVSYIIKSNNYASDFANFLLVPKNQRTDALKIEKCKICRSSKIIVKNQNGRDDVVVYNSEADTLRLKDIKMKNKDENDVSITYMPKV